MSDETRQPYYQIKPSAIPFTAPRFKIFDGSEGCIPINTQQTVSLNRPAPGVSPPPPPPTPLPPQWTPQQIEAIAKAEQQRKEAAAQQAAQAAASAPPAPKPAKPDEEECEKLPEFDLQDVPIAMDAMGWPVSAQISRKWFAGPKNIYDDKPESVQPLDDSIITLEWVLKFDGARKKYDELLKTGIFGVRGLNILKEKLRTALEKKFASTSILDFNTAADLKDLRQFHIDWQFQRVDVSNSDTLDGWTITDLTGALANFPIFAAVGNVEVGGDKYYQYDKTNNTKMYCIEPAVKVTHIYVYIKDSYSFNDVKGSQKSQYLGHWNIAGMILTPGSLASEFLDGNRLGIDVHTGMGNSRDDKNATIFKIPFTKPVDKRPNNGQKFKKDNVYFPVYNKTYNDWRNKHNRGGDLMLYSKPVYIGLKRPI